MSDDILNDILKNNESIMREYYKNGVLENIDRYGKNGVYDRDDIITTIVNAVLLLKAHDIKTNTVENDVLVLSETNETNLGDNA